MTRFAFLLTLAAALVLAACREAPPAAPPVPPAPQLRGSQLVFPANHPQLSQLGVVAAETPKATTVDLPARLVWNEDRTQRIYPALAGRVVRIAADVGGRVQPGTVLAQLVSAEFGAAQAETIKAHADANLSQRTLARQRELFEAGVIARKDLETAEAESARAQAELQRAEARTRLYGGGASSVNQNLSLVAGIAGVIVERNLTPGQELRPDQAGAGTPPLFVVSDPTSLWVLIDARESEVGALRPGAGFTLSVAALPGRKFEGRVMAAADFIDASTRTIKVRGLVPNAERLLKAEMLATATVERSLGAGVMVPAQAVALRGSGHAVIVQVQPGVFERREVTLGYQSPREVLVTKGLQAGEKVVAENVLLLARQFGLAEQEARRGGGEDEGAARKAAPSGAQAASAK